MDEIIKAIAEYGKILKRLMSIQVIEDSSSVCISNAFPFKRIFVGLLWILLTISLLFVLYDLFHLQDTYSLTVLGVFSPLAVLCLLGIRYLSYRFIVKVDEGRFGFIGRFRRDKIFSFNDYAGSETLLTIKNFPEEFVVRFQNAKDKKCYKLADLNKGLARNIEPNHEAVCAFWNSIIQSVERHSDNLPGIVDAAV